MNKRSSVSVSDFTYLSCEAEAAFRLHHLLQNMALDAGGADVFIDDTVLQVDVVYRHADMRKILREGEPAQTEICGETYDSKMVCYFSAY